MANPACSVAVLLGARRTNVRYGVRLTWEGRTVPLQDSFSAHYSELLDGDYDCVDRIVLNGYFRFAMLAGGFRLWWRAWMGSDDKLDKAHLMRMPGRFSRRVRAWAKSCNVPLIDCRSNDRKHEIAESLMPKDPQFTGVFAVLVGRAKMSVWEVIGKGHLERRDAFVNHYSFHILDPEWGHVTIKVCGHAPFTVQVILNGHEYVARQAGAAGIRFRQEGNCFTETSDARALGQIADSLCSKSTIGRLRQVCERWVYTACVCFGVDRVDQERTGFHYDWSVYQGEYSRNLLFHRGRVMERVVQWLIDRTRSALDVKTLKTLFGMKCRPYKRSRWRFEVTVERPEYDLTVLRVHAGLLTLKVYTKGERVLRIEAMVHNARVWRCRRSLENWPELVGRLSGMVSRFLEVLRSVDATWVSDETLEQLPEPTVQGTRRTAGVNLYQRRMRTVLAGVLACATRPGGFIASQLAEQVRTRLGEPYEVRQAAYDLRKLRAKGLVRKIEGRRRYDCPAEGLRTIAAWVTIREHVLRPVLASATRRGPGRPPRHAHVVDGHHARLQQELQSLFETLGIAA